MSEFLLVWLEGFFTVEATFYYYFLQLYCFLDITLRSAVFYLRCPFLSVPFCLLLLYCYLLSFFFSSFILVLIKVRCWCFISSGNPSIIHGSNKAYKGEYLCLGFMTRIFERYWQKDLSFISKTSCFELGRINFPYESL